MPICEDNADFYEVIPYKNKTLIAGGVKMSLYGNRVLIKGDSCEFSFSFDDASAITVLGKNKLDIYVGKKIYQIKAGKRFNALKYVHIYNRYKNVVRGDENVKFLGL